MQDDIPKPEPPKQVTLTTTSGVEVQTGQIPQAQAEYKDVKEQLTKELPTDIIVNGEREANQDSSSNAD
jgi:hypothetical protein